jgi:hypothetical protein
VKNEKRMQETFMFIKKEMDCNFTTKEATLMEREKELQHRACAMEEMTQKLNQREDDFRLLQVDLENDKMKLQKTMVDFEQEKLQLKEVEGAIFEAHELNKNVENVWAKLAMEQSKVGEFIQSMEQTMKPKEDQLCIKEQELLQKESELKELDLQMKSEQEKLKVSS